MDHDNGGSSSGMQPLSGHTTNIKPLTNPASWGMDVSQPAAASAHSQSQTHSSMPHEMSPVSPAVGEQHSAPGASEPRMMPSLTPSPLEEQASTMIATPMAQSFVGGSFAVADTPVDRPVTQAPAHSIPLAAASGNAQSDQPMPVVKVLSVRGLEYLMMSLSLWIADAALLWVVLALFNGEVGFSILAFPLATLLVTGPIFAYLFLRLKKAELLDPSLRFDPSKRRTTQITQLFTFLVCIANVIGFVYVVINKIGGGTGMSIGRAFLNMLAILVVIGGVFAYYWIDEHRTKS